MSTGHHGQLLLHISPVKIGNEFPEEVAGVSGRGKVGRKKNFEDREGLGEKGTKEKGWGAGPIEVATFGIIGKWHEIWKVS